MKNDDTFENKEETIFDFEQELKIVKEELLKDQQYFAKQLEQEGESLLKEMEKKKKKRNSKKDDMILYIIKKTKDEYDVDELREYDYRDILDIYNDVKYQNRPWWIKMFEFFFR